MILLAWERNGERIDETGERIGGFL